MISDYRRTGDPNEIRYCCPFCPNGDIKYKLYFNTRLEIFHCFRCGKSGRKKELEKKLRGYIAYVEQKKQYVKKEKKEYIEMNGNSFIQRMAKNYWKSRGLTVEEQQMYNIKINPKRFSLVVPVRDENGIYVFDIERSLLKDTDTKYYFDPGCPKSKYIFNLDKAKSYPKIYLVEGIFDVMAIGGDGAGLFGKFLSNECLQKLKKIERIREIDIILDNDASKESYDLFNKLLPYFEVRIRDIRETEYKDISEFREKKGISIMKNWLHSKENPSKSV